MSEFVKEATRESYGKALCELGRVNEDFIVLDADLSSATKTGSFKKEFPERFYNCGIAEQNMVAIAAGVATTGKKVLQVLDHCTIYFMIAGTYTPMMLSGLRRTEPVTAWVVFAVVWGIAALAITLTAIDLKKYNVFSMICYIGMGWCVIFTIVPVYRMLTFWGFMLLLGGGIMYTIGAVIYGIGVKKRYMHSLFHIFVDLASLLHFFCIFFYVI